jgi:hypothetical protein
MKIKQLPNRKRSIIIWFVPLFFEKNKNKHTPIKKVKAHKIIRRDKLVISSGEIKRVFTSNSRIARAIGTQKTTNIVVKTLAIQKSRAL